MAVLGLGLSSICALVRAALLLRCCCIGAARLAGALVLALGPVIAGLPHVLTFHLTKRLCGMV